VWFQDDATLTKYTYQYPYRSLQYQYKSQYLSLEYQYRYQYPSLVYQYQYLKTVLNSTALKYLKYQYKYPLLQPW